MRHPALSPSRVLLAAVLVVLGGVPQARAQQSALSVLPEEPPTVIQYRLGPFLVNPNVSVPEIGFDSNVFNEQTAPKEDYVIKLTPDIDFFSDFGVFRVSAKSGSTFTYYHRYDSERSIAQNVRGRVTARLSRVRPWVGGASVISNERSDAEIDARVKRHETELAGGVQFEVSPLALVAISANRIATRFADDEEFRGTRLAPELDRVTDMVSASLRLQATPFTTVTFNGYASRDRFDIAAIRDSSTRGGEVEISFAPEAIIRGKLAVGLREFEPDDPALGSYRGINGRGGVSAVLLWRALVAVNYAREVRYSFDRHEGYYVETGGDVTYTQRIGGPFDVQVRVARQNLDFGAGAASSQRYELLDSYQVGVGYALESRSRIGVSYEHAKRTGETLSDRPFSRRRIFGSFTYEFWK